MAGGCSAGCGSCCVVCCNVMNVKLCLKYLISIYGAVRVLGPGVSSYKGYLLWVSGGGSESNAGPGTAFNLSHS